MPDKTKRPEADSVGHIHTELLPETIAMIQKTIVDLEVDIRLKENECDFYNEIIEELNGLIENGEAIEKIKAKTEINHYKTLLEKSEEECDHLERKQLYYKQQLDSESILPVY